MPEHSAERWVAGLMPRDPQAIQISLEGGGYIAEIRRLESEGPLTPADWRNAWLIAAAPELLAACQAFLRAPSTGSRGLGSVIIARRAFSAIAVSRTLDHKCEPSRSW